MKELEEDFLQRDQFDRFVKEFIETDQIIDQEYIERFIDEIKVLERFSMDSKRFYILFDHTKFYPIYLSKNAEKEFGFSID